MFFGFFLTGGVNLLCVILSSSSLFKAYKIHHGTEIMEENTF